MPPDTKNERPRFVDIVEDELGARLGARPAIYSEKLTLFIAHLDRDGSPVADVDAWITSAEVVLSKIGGGATSVAVRGAWLGDATAPIHEPTTLVYTYAAPEKIEEAVASIRDFALRYGRDTNQGEVAVLLENTDGDWFFSIPLAREKAPNDP